MKHALISQALPLNTCQDESDLSDTDPLELLMKAKKAGYLPSAPLPTAAPRPPAGDGGDKTRNSPNKPAAAVSGPKVSGLKRRRNRVGCVLVALLFEERDSKQPQAPYPRDATIALFTCHALC
jgi:hypothetical protein